MTAEQAAAGALPADPLVAGLMNDDDRRALTLRLAATVAGVSLLGVATLMGRLAPDQMQLAEAGKALAALVVGAPVLGRGLRALFDPRAPSATEPLVALAVLAAMAGGAFGTAVLIPTVMEIGRLFEERSSLGVLAALEGIRRLRAVTAQRETAPGEETVSVESIGDRRCHRRSPRRALRGRRHGVDRNVESRQRRRDGRVPARRHRAGLEGLCGHAQRRRADPSRGPGQRRPLLARARGADARRGGTSADAVLADLRPASRDYLPVVLTIAATVLFFTSDLQRAIAVLVVACPTALLLAGPAAMVAAMTAASRAGILLKSARFLERIGEVDTLVLDKTGTVTQGIQAVRAIVPTEGVDEETVLAAAARCGHGSIHPVSRAIVAAAAARGLEIEAPDIVREFPGLGVAAETTDGNAADRACHLAPRRREGSEHSRDRRGNRRVGGSTTRVCSGGSSSTIPRAPMRVPPSTRCVSLGISRVILLTGDRVSIANEVSTELGLDDVEAEVHPDHKLARVRAEQAAGRVVMMVGDGINDALALAGADVGVAVGSGGTSGVNEVALGGADIALLRPDLAALPQLIRLADRVRAVMTWNAVLGLGGSVASVALAAAGWIGPVAAAAAQSAGVLAVVLNSGRLLRALDVTSRPIPRLGGLLQRRLMRR